MVKLTLKVHQSEKDIHVYKTIVFVKILLLKSYLPSHLRPCRKKPYNMEPQWSQKVGDMNV